MNIKTEFKDCDDTFKTHLDSAVFVKGDTGDPGKSAYEIAV